MLYLQRDGISVFMCISLPQNKIASQLCPIGHDLKEKRMERVLRGFKKWQVWDQTKDLKENKMSCVGQWHQWCTCGAVLCRKMKLKKNNAASAGDAAAGWVRHKGMTIFVHFYSLCPGEVCNLMSPSCSCSCSNLRKKTQVQDTHTHTHTH